MTPWPCIDCGRPIGSNIFNGLCGACHIAEMKDLQIAQLAGFSPEEHRAMSDAIRDRMRKSADEQIAAMRAARRARQLQACFVTATVLLICTIAIALVGAGVL